MYLPPLQAVNNADLCQIGDVTVDPSAVIGIGVILQASPNCRIIIGAGACLGMGTILNACEGTIEIEPGAVLGAGVLMVGEGKIGANASIGAVTTIFNASIEPMKVLAPGSVMGESQSQVFLPAKNQPDHELKKPLEVSPVKPAQSPNQSQQQPASSPDPVNSIQQSDVPQSSTQSQQHAASSDPVVNQDNQDRVGVGSPNPQAKFKDDQLPLTTDENPEAESIDESSSTTNSTSDLSDRPSANQSNAGEDTQESPIYGQVYISRMLGTIFPQGQSINRRPQNHQ
jgi:carbon dioxide concentrating mechanism protein CcmN